MGATDLINASNIDPVEAIKDMTGGGVEFSFEAVGLKRTAEQCFESLRPGGTATIIGMVPYGMKIELHGYDSCADGGSTARRWAATGSASRCRSS